MLKKLFLTPFFCCVISFSMAATADTNQASQTSCASRNSGISQTSFTSQAACASQSFGISQRANASQSSGIPRLNFDLGIVTVEAPTWNHPEEITGKPDGETFFENTPTTGKTTLSEALDGLLGINLRTSGGAGSIAALSSGGLSGNKILVIKDGLPVNDPFTGSPDIGDFSTVQFDKAELWKGNRATLWGSNSIGGTLRLSSRFPDYGRLRLWTDGIGGNGRSFETRFYPGAAKLGIRLSQFKTPGFSSAASENGNTERDAFELDNGYIAMETYLRQNLQLQMSSEFSESLTELDGFDFVSGLPADSLDFRQKKLNSQFNMGLINRLADGELRLSHVFSHSSYTGVDESNPFNEYGLETSRQKQSVSRSYEIAQGHFLAEIARTETRAQNHGIFVNRETDLAGVFAFERQLNQNLAMNATARYDDPQNHQAVTTGNLAITRQIEDVELSAAWGQAFRMPALNERYYPAYGDPALDAEFSTSVGFAAARQFKDIGKVSVSATQYQVRDLIGTTATTDPAYTWGIKAANLNRAQIISHQFSLSDCKIARLNLSGEFTLMDKARLLDTGKQVPGIAARQAALRLEKKIDQTKYALHSKWWGPVWENAENSKSSRASHEVSLYLTRSFKECSLEIGLLNLTDATTQRVLGYTRPGKRLTLAFETSF